MFRHEDVLLELAAYVLGEDQDDVASASDWDLSTEAFTGADPALQEYIVQQVSISCNRSVHRAAGQYNVQQVSTSFSWSVHRAAG